MADNYIYVIRKAKPIECDICEYKGGICIDKDVICPMEKGKTQAEYEDMILQTINKELDKVLKNGEKINNIGLAKAVVDRLFGEGE